jgi:hypothetical protein
MESSFELTIGAKFDKNLLVQRQFNQVQRLSYCKSFFINFPKSLIMNTNHRTIRPYFGWGPLLIHNDFFLKWEKELSNTGVNSSKNDSGIAMGFRILMTSQTHSQLFSREKNKSFHHKKIKD